MASLKDHEHGRRAVKSSPDILFDCHKTAYPNQSHFLANNKNKANFVKLLMSSFENEGYTTHQAVNDADTLIVAKALDVACGESVTVVANDTDILTLLLYHFKPNLHPMYLHYEVNTRNGSRTTMLCIPDMRAAIGDTAARQLLVVHALSGCDTTSCLYGHGKGSVWRKLTTNPNTVQLTDIIDSVEATHDMVTAAGLQLLVLLYGGKPCDSLNQLRYARYMDITATAMVPLRPERLPPTENAAKFHLFRTHMQVLQWKTLMKVNANPCDWGWKVLDGRYVPITTDLEAAPESMLSVIRCRCKTDTKHPCSSQLCTCKKYGLLCVAACKHCQGCECENPGIVISFSDDTDIDEEELECEAEEFDPSDIMSDDGLEFAMPWVDEEVV